MRRLVGQDSYWSYQRHSLPNVHFIGISGKNKSFEPLLREEGGGGCIPSLPCGCPTPTYVVLGRQRREGLPLRSQTPRLEVIVVITLQLVLASLGVSERTLKRVCKAAIFVLFNHVRPTPCGTQKLAVHFYILSTKKTRSRKV